MKDIEGLKVYETSFTDRLSKRFNDWLFTRSFWMLVYFYTAIFILSQMPLYVQVMLLVSTDQLLTHWQLWNVQKKTGYWQLELEMNFIPRNIMKLFDGHPTPKNFLFGSIVFATLLGFSVSVSTMIGTPESLIGAGSVYGLFFAVNVYHIGGLTRK
jgi:hypothetical protein